MEPTILFENNDVVVVNKPSGLRVHNDAHSTESTLVDWLLEYYPAVRGVGEQQVLLNGDPMERSGVVHRLDRDTSGVLILAKHQVAFLDLKQQFKDRLVQKEYRAFVYGTMNDKWGTIKRPIGRSAKDFKLRSAQPGAKGTLRDAQTDWELIGQSFTHAYIKLRPKTGRTHQLRVHLKSLDRSIVMDPLYASEHQRTTNDSLGFERLALHAHQLELTLPHGEVERFIAPTPVEFEEAAERILSE
jgi:23S rRNA pseudouridine1911/1915/1917 synthase